MQIAKPQKTHLVVKFERHGHNPLSYSKNSPSTWPPHSIFVLMGFGTTVLLVFWAFFSAWFSVIDDCDEVYNYWEPVHHLLYGGGFQTWEYAPQFALRSYWYPGAMALIGYPLSFFLPKLAVFFALRLVLGLFYASCAQFFINSCPPWESSKISVFSALLTIGTCTAGSFAASTALLPNSLSMCLYMVTFGCWMRGLPAFAVIFGALGWTFV